MGLCRYNEKYTHLMLRHFIVVPTRSSPIRLESLLTKKNI